MVFHDVRFPTRLSRGAQGGPERRTDVVLLGSGREERNSRWADSRRRYNAGTGARTLDDLSLIVSFFEARMGQLHAFRWRDPADFKSGRPSELPTSTDQNLGAGDGAQRNFKLRKYYGDVAAGYWREISLPVVDSLLVAVDGVDVPASDFVFDSEAHCLTFVESAVPPIGSLVTAGFLFDVPVRFDTDRLALSVESFQHGAIPEIPVVEVRL